jgi:hypothetical protein
MKELIAYCGMVCVECRTYLATRNNDIEAKAVTAEDWNKRYKLSLKTKDINCDGCLAVGKRQIGYCHVCDIRVCGSAKKILNCSYCVEYPCVKLNKVHAYASQAKAKLDAIQKEKK